MVFLSCYLFYSLSDLPFLWACSTIVDKGHSPTWPIFNEKGKRIKCMLIQRLSTVQSDLVASLVAYQMSYACHPSPYISVDPTMNDSVKCSLPLEGYNLHRSISGHTARSVLNAGNQLAMCDWKPWLFVAKIHLLAVTLMENLKLIICS